MPRLLRWLCFSALLFHWWTAGDGRGSAAWACFAVVAGREATEDGSVLVGHNEQDRGVRVLNFCRVPRQTHAAGQVVRLRRGGTTPEVPRTAAYLWSQCPREEFADSFLNEHGVCIVSDRCPTRQDEVDGLVAPSELRDGGIGLMLRRLVAQRAKTAREGVELVGRLVERFGYVTSGRSYVIADPNEAWIVALVGGRQWAAQRVPDDSVVILPNVHIIRQIDLKDTANFLGSPDVIDYAVNRAWYNPTTDGPFDLRRVYRKEREDSPDTRRWIVYKTLTGRDEPWPPKDPIPFAVRLKKKMSVASMAAVLRHRQGERAISETHTLEAAVFQLRRDMPPEIGCVYWRSTCEPSSGVLIPWHAGVDDVPADHAAPTPLEERMTTAWHFDPPNGLFEPNDAFAWWTFKGLQDWVHEDYDGRIGPVRERWAAMEKDILARQRQVEREALRLWPTDPSAARALLTRYSAELAGRAKKEGEAIRGGRRP